MCLSMKRCRLQSLAGHLNYLTRLYLFTGRWLLTLINPVTICVAPRELNPCVKIEISIFGNFRLAYYIDDTVHTCVLFHVLLSHSPAAALPELSYILLPRLRRYMKHTQRPQWRKLAGDVINKLESAAFQVKQSRDEEFGAPSEFPGLVNSLPRRKQQHSIMVEKLGLSSSSPAREVAETVVHHNIEQQDLPHLQGNRNVKKRRFKKAATLQAELGCLGDENADIVQDLKGIWSDNEE